MDIPTTGRSIIAVGLPDCARKCVDVDAAGARTCASNTASEPDRINLETPRTAMLLAAGRGERMRPLTDSLPKPLLEAGGYPLLHYPLQALAVAGVDKVVINLAWQGGKIREWLGSGEDYGLRIFFSEEGEQALETGGGIYRALPLLGDAPFWLVNGDVYCDFPFTAGRLAADDLAHLVMVDNPAHHRGGDFCLRQGRVREEGGEKLTYSGLAILRPELFAASRAGVFPLAPLLMEALRADQVSGERYAGEWTDVGTPQRLAELDQRLRGKT